VDRRELGERQHTAHEEADSLKRDVPRITLLNEPRRHYESDGSGPTEHAGEPGEDRQIGVQPDPAESTHPKRSERPLVR